MIQVWANVLTCLPVCTAAVLTADGDRLYVFSVSGVGNGGDCQVPITAGGEQIVCVISIRGEGEVCVVREKGFLEQFSQQDLSWKGIGNNTTPFPRVQVS